MTADVGSEDVEPVVPERLGEFQPQFLAQGFYRFGLFFGQLIGR